VSVRFDAVLFDVGGVLAVPDPVQIGAALSPLGGTTDVATIRRNHYAALAALEVAVDQAGLGTVEGLPWQAYWSMMAEGCGVSPANLAAGAKAVERLWSPYLWFHPLHDSIAALGRLHRSGVPIGVVSNAAGQVEHMLRYQGICQVGPGMGAPVLCVVDSEIVGVAKPDPAIFDFALPHFPGIDRARIAYIGDTFHNDVLGARAAGLAPLLLDPHNDRAHRDCERITSVHDVLAWV
jgi:putative hydrolase of the HAD superfamily